MTTEGGHEGRGRAVLSVLAAATLFGTTGTAQALGPSGTTPLGVGAARIVIGGAGLLAVLPRLGGRRRDAVALWRTPWGVTAGITTALYQVCFFAGVSRAGVALGTLVTIGSGPVFTGLLSWVLLRERPRLSWVVATAVCVVGLALLVGSGASQPSVDPVGLLLALASGFGYAVYTVAAKRLMTDGHRSDEVMAGAFSLGGLLLVPVLLTQPMAWITTPSGLAMALWLGLGHHDCGVRALRPWAAAPAGRPGHHARPRRAGGRHGPRRGRAGGVVDAARLGRCRARAGRSRAAGRRGLAR